MELNLANFITLNGHGSYTEAMVEIPPNIYVLIPNESGLQEGYTFSAPTGTFESIIYNNKIPVFSKTCKGKTQEAGWKLYRPGEQINDMNISPFHTGDEAGGDAKTCDEYKGFTNGNGKLMKNCDKSSECIVYVDKGVPSYDPMVIDGNHIFKVKICNKTLISDIFSKLKIAQETSSDPQIKTPIVLIPFICNAKTGENYVLDPKETKDESIVKLFDNLYLLNTSTPTTTTTTTTITTPSTTTTNIPTTPSTTTTNTPTTTITTTPTTTTTPTHVKSNKILSEQLEPQDTEVKEFREELLKLTHSDPEIRNAIQKLLGDPLKKTQIPISVDNYKDNEYTISKLIDDDYEPIDEDDEVGNEILTFYKYSKTKITFNGEDIEIKGSLKDENGDNVPLFFKVGSNIYKMEIE